MDDNSVMSDLAGRSSSIDPNDARTAAELLPLVYEELRLLAAARLNHEKPGQTLQATALVHEAYLRLIGGGAGEDSDPNAPAFHSRSHFFAAAAEAMRRILIDAARRKQCQRHGGGAQRMDLLDEDLAALPVNDELLDLDAALTKLSAVDAQAAEMVKLRVFAGMTVEEAAAVTGVSPRTAKRHWAYARAWLGRELATYGRDSN